MIVWRLETAEGQGPYTTQARGGCGTHEEESPFDWGGGVNGLHQRPAPHNDGMAGRVRSGSDWTFGFSSITQLCAWWNVADLAQVPRFCGEPLLLAQYRVLKSMVEFGGKQVAFKRESATLLGRLDLADFIREEKAK